MLLMFDMDVLDMRNLEMHPDIVIVRSPEGFRLLHGYLRLANLLRNSKKVAIHVPGEGDLTIAQTREGLHVSKGQECYKLLLS